MSRSESDGVNDHHQRADEVAMNDRSGGPHADLPVWRRRDGWRDRQARQVCRVEVGPAHHVTQQQVHPDIARGRVRVRHGLVRAGGVVVGVPGIPGLVRMPAWRPSLRRAGRRRAPACPGARPVSAQEWTGTGRPCRPAAASGGAVHWRWAVRYGGASSADFP